MIVYSITERGPLLKLLVKLNCRYWKLRHCNFKIPQEFFDWLGCSSNYRVIKISKPISFPSWRVRLSTDNFSLWWQSKGVATIFFDGASKENPSVAGAGGLIFSPGNEKVSCFCWGLGICSNNQAENYSLLMACQVARKIGFKDIQIFRDSEVLIKLLNSASQLNRPSLDETLQ